MWTRREFIEYLLVLVVFYCSVNVNGQRRPASCNAFFEWSCDNGECISIAKRCDGMKHCSDGSDETVKECIAFRCPAETKFRCTYGGCIDKNQECNGVQNCADNSDELTEKCNAGQEARLRGNCPADQYQCSSGECISADDFCDGYAHCRDKSDERIESCATACCSGFRCGYGACVDDQVKCNGVSDCLDGSDENYLLCGTSRTGPMPPLLSQPPASGVWEISRGPSGTDRPTLPPPPALVEPGACRIVKIPRNGWIEHAAPPHIHLSIGEYVSQYQSVHFRCHDNFLPDGANSSFCNSGKWLEDVPDCQAFCDPREINTYALQAQQCRRDGQSVRCSDRARPGTKADVYCQNRYESAQSSLQMVTCNERGLWSPSLQPCTPICGEEAPEGVAFIVGGHETDIRKAPWHAIIYQYRDNDLNLICGGTILNARVIISAMHCMWDRLENKAGDLSVFRVVVGKGFADYLHIADRQPQYFNVSQIFYDEAYADLTGNYERDIVLLLLNDNIIFQAHIAPICIPYHLRNDDRTIPNGDYGRVAGFGLTTSGGQISPVLKIVELPAVSRRQCLSVSENDQLLTSDKFCAGFVDLDVAVCEGDSGGGLVFPETRNGKKKFWLRGIVSTGPRKGLSCDSNKYTTFTNILYYESLLRNEEQFRPK